MYPFILTIGSFKIPSYGLMLAISFMLGIAIAKKRAHQESLDPREVESLTFWIIVSAILGARFLYTFVEHGDHYWKHPIEFFYFRSGGLSFFGGLIFAVGVSIYYCWKKNIPFWAMADLMAPSLALGLGITKIGCFLAGCCFGRACDLPWGIAFTHPETLAHPKGIPLHPTQLYESILGLALFGLLLLYRRWRRFEGEVFLLFVALYGILRSYLEIYRADPGHLGSLTTAQFLSIPMVAFAIGYWIFKWNRSRT